MARDKAKSGRLSVFKGREAKLNRVIFQILALKGPLTIYDLLKQVKQQRFFRRKLYSVVLRRVRMLQESGYVEKVGIRKTLAGQTGNLYRLTPRAYLAILLNQTDMDGLLKKADETTIHELIATLAKQLDRSNLP